MGWGLCACLGHTAVLGVTTWDCCAFFLPFDTSQQALPG